MNPLHHRLAIRTVAILLSLAVTFVRADASPGASEPSSKRLTRHPISITEASVFVTRTKAIVRIQMFAEDLVLFQGLEPNDQDRIQPEDLRRGLEDHKAFLLEKFTIRDAAGERLKGEITDLKPFEIPENGIPSNEMMQHSATYELEYSFAAPPEFLTFQQDIADANFIIPSEMSLTVHQSGTGLNFTERLMPGGSTTIRFDWTQTLSEDASDAEWDSWFEKQREATLGITSYSSVYSFIYIDPTEIRHEILIPLATLKTILPVKHADPAFVEIEEQDAIRTLIRDWLKSENPVTINGSPVSPEFTRIDFYSLNLSDFATQAKPQRVSLASGRIGVIMTYRTPDDVIHDATVSWNLYYSTLTKIPAVVIGFPDRMDRFEFSRFNKAEDNTLTWKSREEDLPKPVELVTAGIPEKPVRWIPVGSIVFAVLGLMSLRFTQSSARWGAVAACLIGMIAVRNVAGVTIDDPFRSPVPIPDSEAKDVFTKLHRGMYRSLDFGNEERIYDVLASSVDGKLLETLYVQLRKSLELREQGGAVARIREITYDASDVVRDAKAVKWPGFEMHAKWTVAGTVEHWGHVHERQNQFDAIVAIEPRDGAWKITRMDVTGQTQKSARTTLRKF